MFLAGGSLALMLLLIICMASSFSGLLPAIFRCGYTVSPDKVERLTGNGSMSTVWYLGSDRKHHYFSHLVKVTTDYRVRREEMILSDGDEFQLEQKKPVLADRIFERAE